MYGYITLDMLNIGYQEFSVWSAAVLLLCWRHLRKRKRKEKELVYSTMATQQGRNKRKERLAGLIDNHVDTGCKLCWLECV